MVTGADGGMWLSPPWSTPLIWYCPGGAGCVAQFGVAGVEHAAWLQETWSVCDHVVPRTVGDVNVAAHPVLGWASDVHIRVPEESSMLMAGQPMPVEFTVQAVASFRKVSLISTVCPGA